MPNAARRASRTSFRTVRSPDRRRSETTPSTGTPRIRRRRRYRARCPRRRPSCPCPRRPPACESPPTGKNRRRDRASRSRPCTSPRGVLSISSINCIVLYFGAPVIEPHGNSARRISANDDAGAQRAPRSSTSSARPTHTARPKTAPAPARSRWQPHATCRCAASRRSSRFRRDSSDRRGAPGDRSSRGRGAFHWPRAQQVAALLDEKLRRTRHHHAAFRQRDQRAVSDRLPLPQAAIKRQRRAEHVERRADRCS